MLYTCRRRTAYSGGSRLTTSVILSASRLAGSHLQGSSSDYSSKQCKFHVVFILLISG